MKNTLLLRSCVIALSFIGFIFSTCTAQPQDDIDNNKCVSNLRYIEAAKDAYSMEHGLPKGWTWSNNANAFKELYRADLRASAYIREYPHCPSSTNTTRSPEQAANEYAVNPISSNAACKVRHDHRLPHSEQTSQTPPHALVTPQNPAGNPAGSKQ